MGDKYPIVNNCHTAPKDGSIFLIDDQAADGRRCMNSVYFLDLPMDEGGGLFVYADEALADICPSGPEVPFQWYAMPEQKEGGGDG